MLYSQPVNVNYVNTNEIDDHNTLFVWPALVRPIQTRSCYWRFFGLSERLRCDQVLDDRFNETSNAWKVTFGSAFTV